jgi:hypothetical protein
VAPELGAARRLAGEVELLSAQYLFARAAGRPVVLSAREMTVVAKKFAGYGPRRREATG